MAARGSAGRGRGRGDGDPDVALSKTMAWALRHGAGELGLSMGPDGFVPLDELLRTPQMRALGASEPRVQRVVANSAKQRFALESRGGRLFVRANQGHGADLGRPLDDEALLKRVERPEDAPFCAHGTNLEAWEKFIRHEGLSRMRRKHIHFASRPKDGGAISGMRGSADVVVHVDVAAAMRAGAAFYRSSNDVLLSEGIEGFIRPHLFARVEQVDRVGRVLRVLWQPPAPAEEKAEAPAKPSPAAAAAAAAPAAAPAPAAERDAAPRLLLVLDFEATCDDGTPLEPQEVIEFPCVVLDAASGRVLAMFHEYVRPVANPRLTAFCTKLTGIAQETVAAAAPFGEVWRRFVAFLQKHEVLSETEQPAEPFAFVTCGDWDLASMLPRQCATSGLRVPAWARRWVNIKRSYEEAFGSKVRGMGDLLRVLKLELLGRHHSGIDDTKNIVRACQAMLAKGFVFQVNGWARKPES
jgi:inhibitor of KinA sporulation pathway (predicted exonuclease)/RNA:NAD 2'-phosphotransferase (TPT1/KptA family)